MSEVAIFSEMVCELGEGPAFDPQSGKLFWFDIVGQKLLEKKYPDGPTIVTAFVSTSKPASDRATSLATIRSLVGAKPTQPSSPPHHTDTQAWVASAPCSRGLPGGGMVRI